MNKEMKKIDSSVVKVVNGQLVIDNPELVNAIATQEVDLFVPEDEAGMFGFCFAVCKGIS